jgi:anti-sigma B factor antagonist
LPVTAAGTMTSPAIRTPAAWPPAPGGEVDLAGAAVAGGPPSPLSVPLFPGPGFSACHPLGNARKAMISYRNDNGAWLNVAEDHALATPAHPPGRCDDAMHGAGGLVDLKLGHDIKDGIEVIDVAGTIDISTAPRLRELLIDLVSTDNYQLIVNLERVEFLDSTGLGVLVGGLKRVRAHDGSLDLVCTQERILKIFRITGLTKVFGIHQTVDQAIAAKKGHR